MKRSSWKAVRGYPPGNHRPSRTNIPESIKRAVRRRCGFGCIICGKPIYDYDHLLGWSKVRRHVAEEVTILCAEHHREKTAEWLPLAKVLAANKQPYCLREGRSAQHFLHYDGNDCEISIGGNTFGSNLAEGFPFLAPICIDKTPVISFRKEDEHLLLTLRLCDEANQLLLEIVDNQLVQSVLPWDIELVGTRLTIRDEPRAIRVDIMFSPPDKVAIERGRFFYNGVEILVSRDRLQINNVGSNAMTGKGNATSGVPFFVVIGAPPDNGAAVMWIHDVQRHAFDRGAAEAWTREAFAGERTP